MKCINTFAPKIVENNDKKKLKTKINKNIPVVFKIFLLNKSFKLTKNAISGFLFLKNRAGMYKNNE